MTNILTAILITLSAFFIPLYPVMIATTTLIVIDTIFGILAAKKRGRKITSKRMSHVLIKMLVYNLLIITGALVEIYTIPWMPVIKIIVSFIGMVELFSIGESFTVITDKPFLTYIKQHLFKNFKIEGRDRSVCDMTKDLIKSEEHKNK